MTHDLVVDGGHGGHGAYALTPPGDKSISHRALILGAATPGNTRLDGLNRSDSVEVLLPALRALGVPIAEGGDGGFVLGSLTDRVAPPDVPRLDLGSSSTAARLLIGFLAGAGIAAVIDGDASLRARPMDWVVDPLRALGARLAYRGERGRLPIAVERGDLTAGTVRLSVGSAQARSAVLLAAVAARVEVEMLHRVRSRDHTERMLGHLGILVEERPGRTTVRGAPLPALPHYRIPGDPSSAACLAAAHVLRGGRGTLRVRDVCVNPTRIGLLDLLSEMGADVRQERRRIDAREPVADIVVGSAPSDLRPFTIADEERLHSLIDEVPLAAALATRADGRSTVGCGAELRFKETDRLETTRAMVAVFGVEARVEGDALAVEGTRALRPAVVSSFGDHRIAMAGVALAGAIRGTSRVLGGDCVATSFPRFVATLVDAGHDVREVPAEESPS